jgi:hypothetical protein
LGELRCPKCQNQNLAGSDAPIAKDLKDRTYQLLQDGKTDSEIRDYMVDRVMVILLVINRLYGAVPMCCGLVLLPYCGGGGGVNLAT